MSLQPALPVGLPGQVLTTDFLNQSPGGVSWKNFTSPASSGILTQNVNTLAMYCEVYDTSYGTPIPVAGVDIPFNKQRRLDSVFVQSADLTTIQVNDVGAYLGSYRVGVGYVSDSVNTLAASIQTCLRMDQVDGNGFGIVPGTYSYCTLDPSVAGESKTNMTVQFVIVLTNSGSRFKVTSKEYNTTTGNVSTKPELSNFSLVKAIIQDPTGISSQEFFAYCMSSLSYPITTTYTNVIFDTIGIGSPAFTSPNSNNYVDITQSQNYYISTNLSFQAIGCPVGSVLTLQGHMMRKFSAGTNIFIEVPGSLFTCTIHISNTNTIYESASNGIYMPLVSGDRLLYQVKVLNAPTSGTVTFINNACNFTGLSVYSPTTGSLIRDFSGYSTNPKQLSLLQYTDVPLQTEIVKHPSILHQSGSPIVQVGPNGTYLVLGSITVRNTDIIPCVIYSNFMVDSGNGFTYTAGTQSLACIYPGGSETIFQTLVLYMGYNFQIKMQCLLTAPLGVSASSLTAEVSSSNLLLVKFEETLTLLVPTVNSFGNYYSKAIDSDVLTTTVTLFMPRLSLTSRILPFGQYRLFYTFSWTMTNVGVPFQVKIVMDGTSVIYTLNQTAIVSNYFQTELGVLDLGLLPGIHTFVLSIATGDILHPCMTKNVSMEIWQVIE